MNSMNWTLCPLPSAEKVKELATQLSTSQPFPLPIAAILLQRNISDYEEAKAFFVPEESELHDPFLMKDMDVAISRIIAARQSDEKILLFGDYDVDGTSAVTLMLLFFREWGFNVEYYIPDRYKEGYGVSFQGIDHAVEIGANLMISLDCGIKAIDKVKYAKVKGIDFIICDHHTPGESLPEAIAVLDPKRPEDSYPFKELTGCGVGFKLLQALQTEMVAAGYDDPQKKINLLARYADLVTLSIGCDIVPITGENRVIAHYGLKKLQADPLPGIKILMNQAKERRTWNISDLVFFVGPRINAAGRLGHAREAVEVLTGNGDETVTLAESLQVSNDERKSLDQQITEEALSMIEMDDNYLQKSTTVLYNADWHKGVIGIVASRLIEKHYRPTVLLTESEGKWVGSARSVVGFNLYEALEGCADHLLQFGGHKYAAGMSIKTEELAAFSEKFDKVVAAQILPEQKKPTLRIDHELAFSEIEARFIRLLNRMAPFGPGNRTPVFMTSNVKVVHTVVMKEIHLRMAFEKEGFMFEAVGFSMAEKWFSFTEEQRQEIDIAYQLTFNTWNNKTKINLRLKDIRPSHA